MQRGISKYKGWKKQKEELMCSFTREGKTEIYICRVRETLGEGKGVKIFSIITFYIHTHVSNRFIVRTFFL